MCAVYHIYSQNISRAEIFKDWQTPPLNINFHDLIFKGYTLGCLYHNVHYNIASHIDCDVAAS